MAEATLAELREGDRILIEVTVGKERIGAKSVVCILPSSNSIVIHADEDIQSILENHLKVGDFVKWWEHAEWRRGQVIGIDVDKSIPASPKTSVWVKDDHQWPRRTFDIRDLKRA